MTRGCSFSQTVMRTPEDRSALARDCLRFLAELG